LREARALITTEYPGLLNLERRALSSQIHTYFRERRVDTLDDHLTDAIAYGTSGIVYRPERTVQTQELLQVKIHYKNRDGWTKMTVHPGAQAIPDTLRLADSSQITVDSIDDSRREVSYRTDSTPIRNYTLVKTAIIHDRRRNRRTQEAWYEEE
jgi:hypothetical protein